MNRRYQEIVRRSTGMGLFDMLERDIAIPYLKSQVFSLLSAAKENLDLRNYK